MSIGHRDGEARKVKLNTQKIDTAEKTSKNIDWKQIGRFVSLIVKLFSHLTECFKALNVGPEILEWITGEGKGVFEAQFVLPLARRYTRQGADFKHWKTICAIEDWHLRIALTNVDIKSELGIKLQAAFPECFIGTKERGPVPLSALYEVARQNNVILRHRVERPELCLYWMEALQNLDVPCIYGTWSHEFYERHGKECGWVLFESSFEPGDVGNIVEYHNQKYLVVEFQDVEGKGDTYECCIVPIECIDLDTAIVK